MTSSEERTSAEAEGYRNPSVSSSRFLVAKGDFRPAFRLPEHWEEDLGKSKHRKVVDVKDPSCVLGLDEFRRPKTCVAQCAAVEEEREGWKRGKEEQRNQCKEKNSTCGNSIAVSVSIARCG